MIAETSDLRVSSCGNWIHYTGEKCNQGVYDVKFGIYLGTIEQLRRGAGTIVKTWAQKRNLNKDELPSLVKSLQDFIGT